MKDEKYLKVRDHCHYARDYRGAAYSVCSLKYNVLKKMSDLYIVDLAIIIILLWNAENYITFTVPIEKEVTLIDKSGGKITKNISYILQFIHSARFIASSLSDLVNNLSKWIQRIKYKYRHRDKTRETCRIKYKNCDCFFQCTNFKDSFKQYKNWCLFYF